MSAPSPRKALAFVAAAAALGAIFWLRGRARPSEAPPPSDSVEPTVVAPTPAEPMTVPEPSAAASPSGSATIAEPAQVPVVEPKGSDPATLADVTAAVRSAIKKEVRRCNPGRPITPAIANKRIVFYFTQQLVSGAVKLVDVAKIDSDLDDARLESCILNRVADVRLSAPGATDAQPRLQETVDLRDLAP